MSVPLSNSADAVRFVFDENLLKVGRALCNLRSGRDMGCVGDSTLKGLIDVGDLDHKWIPVAGARGWVVITHDKRLRTRPAEAQLAVEHRLKVVHLHQAGSMTAWEQAVRLMSAWPAVEEHVRDAGEGPWWLDVRKGRVDSKTFQPGYPER